MLSYLRKSANIFEVYSNEHELAGTVKIEFGERPKYTPSSAGYTIEVVTLTAGGQNICTLFPPNHPYLNK